MPRFLVTLSIEVPAEAGDKAIENVSEFFHSVKIDGKPSTFYVDDIKLITPHVPNDE